MISPDRPQTIVPVKLEFAGRNPQRPDQVRRLVWIRRPRRHQPHRHLQFGRMNQPWKGFFRGAKAQTRLWDTPAGSVNLNPPVRLAIQQDSKGGHGRTGAG
jgi:hypothetical protein